MAKRRYTDEDRANALVALAANAGHVKRTAGQLGIPARTLESWARGERHPEASQMCERKKEDMAAALEDVAWKLLESIPSKIADAPLSQTATSMGIAIDKARLLRNEPTEITQRDAAGLSESEIDARIAELEARIAGAKAAEGGGRPPQTLPLQPA